ncbi:MAG: hypothetical protein ACXVQX_03325 [Actinomycetota bacterium]
MRLAGMAGVLSLLTLLACPASHPASRPFSSFVNPSYSSTADPAAALRRPMKLPTVGSGKGCPISSGRATEIQGSSFLALGPGPAYPAFTLDRDRSGTYRYNIEPVNGWVDISILWLVEPRARGPILVRGAQVDGPAPLGVFVGQGALLLDVPTSVDDRARAILIPTNLTGAVTDSGWRFYPGVTSIQQPGCYAFQFDGTDFSYVVVFRLAR